MPTERSRPSPTQPMPSRVTFRVGEQVYTAEAPTRLEALALVVEQMGPVLKEALQRREARLDAARRAAREAVHSRPYRKAQQLGRPA